MFRSLKLLSTLGLIGATGLGAVTAAGVGWVTWSSPIKTDFSDQGGFGTIGWAPEGQVYFNYEVVLSPNSGAYTASAAADIDGDSDPQAWGYVHPAAGNTTTSSATSCVRYAIVRISSTPITEAAVWVMNVNSHAAPSQASE